MYGTSINGNDVTAVCQSIVNTGSNDIKVINSVLGPDPQSGATKYFGILYTTPQLNHGNPIALGCQEGTDLDLLCSTTVNTPTTQPLATANNVVILAATYGASSNGTNVTALCQALINNGNIIMPVNVVVMGPDPQVGSPKFFAIRYSVTKVSTGTRIYSLACQDGTNLGLVGI